MVVEVPSNALKIIGMMMLLISKNQRAVKEIISCSYDIHLFTIVIKIEGGTVHDLVYLMLLMKMMTQKINVGFSNIFND